MIRNLEKIVKIIFIVILFWTTLLFFYAVFCSPIIGEAYTGSFKSKELNDGWTLVDENGNVTENIHLPMSVRETEGTTVQLKRILPSDVHDGMRLCTRSSRQDITVSIDGRVHGKYSKNNFMFKRKMVVSAYLLIDLHDDDAGKEIVLTITPGHTGSGTYNAVSYAYGNNVWFPLLTDYMPLALMALLLIMIGFATVIVYTIFHRNPDVSKTLFYLGMFIGIVGMWIASECHIKQLYFGSPSLSNVFSFILIEIMAGFAAMYFNEVQEHRYQKGYLIIGTIILLQVLINAVLSFTQTVDFYETLFISHTWTGIFMIFVIYTIVRDIKTGDIKRYSINAIGIFSLVGAAFFELIDFYNGAKHIGFFLAWGLLFMLATTIIQTVKNMLNRAEERRLRSEKLNEMTFQTIASTIDAKDEYTGGHSERVGDYARKIAEKIARAHNLSEDDLNRIQYIGKMHDIGKIGVADSVLKKKGRLDLDEYAQMKQHTVIGSDILKNLDTIEGLKEGVRSHHERWDGRGYPDGLKEEEIPLFARILCLADCFDAMTTDRVYRKRLSYARVIEEIETNKGTQFDPELAEIVLAMINDGELPC